MTAATSTSTKTAQPDSSKLSSGLRSGSSGGGRRDSSSSSSNKNLSHVPCKFYRQGACQAGSSCPFSHADEGSDQTPCKYFLKGNCKFGSKCALAHILPDGRRVNNNHNRSRRESNNNHSQQNGKHSPPRSLPVNMNSGKRTMSASSRPLYLASSTASAASPLSGSIWNNGTTSTSMYTDSAIIDDDEAVDDDDILIDEEDFVPSSLTDLLTPQERQRRDSRREQYSRPSFSDISDSPLPHHPSRLLNPIGTPDKKHHHPPDDTQFFMEDDTTHQNNNVMT